MHTAVTILVTFLLIIHIRNKIYYGFPSRQMHVQEHNNVQVCFFFKNWNMFPISDSHYMNIIDKRTLKHSKIDVKNVWGPVYTWY